MVSIIILEMEKGGLVGMIEDKMPESFRYGIWVFCTDKRGVLGWHLRVVSSRSDSKEFVGLVCLRCKYVRLCFHCGVATCAYGHALRYKPCGNYAANVEERCEF